MKITAEKGLFWFLKEGADFDLSDKKQEELYDQLVELCRTYFKKKSVESVIILQRS